MFRFLIGIFALTLGAHLAVAQPTPPPAASVAPPSALAESIYAAARPKLLQIRTLVGAAGSQSTTGSGFLVGADGFAITNYHVVSQYALEPSVYRLEYAAADGTHGPLELLAIDLANDLAVVRLDKRDQAFFSFEEQAVKGTLPRGEHLYSLGNPLDLGFTIVDGTYNGSVERSYADRIHFSGALNPGMSGGPAVTEDSKVVGINVAKQLGGELISFLVPARFAVALLDRAHSPAAMPAKDWRAEIGRQLTAWQVGLYQAMLDRGFRTVTVGPYQAPESAAPWFSCWARTTAGQIPVPRASIDLTNCNSDTRLFVANDFNTGSISVSHSLLKSSDLNPFQFATFVSQQFQYVGTMGNNQKWYAPERCHDDFVQAGPPGDHPPLRAVWCAHALREFDGLYDVAFMVVTQDRDDEALIARLNLQGISYDAAAALAKRFTASVQWKK